MKLGPSLLRDLSNINGTILAVINFYFNPSAREEKVTYFLLVFLEAEIFPERNFWSTEKPVRNTIHSSILTSL